MRDVTLARPLAKGYIQCTACEHWCALAPGAFGKCGVRRNCDGCLDLIVYGRAVAVHLDPVEKKPLHHLLPGTSILSFGTVGCNLTCAWCQNWAISQYRPALRRYTGDAGMEAEEVSHLGQEWLPERIVATCVARGIPSIAFTYNEPAVFFEYAYDTARLASAMGLRTVIVSSGFETAQALELLAPCLTAANIDLKAFRDETYRTCCGARLEPVKRNIRHLHELGVWVEVTTLVIPGLNDGDAELGAIAAFLASISRDIPWHVSAFAPNHRMRDCAPTPAATLKRACDLGKQAGLRYVYAGNIWSHPALEGCADTACPECGTLLLERAGFATRPRWQEPGRCHACGAAVAGVWT
jgi:pyruvate formate lyase activating enzyme